MERIKMSTSMQNGINNNKGRIILLLLVVCIFTLMQLLTLTSAKADDDEDSGSGKAANSLQVKVGYSGQVPELKKEYTVAQLEALGTKNQRFSWLTSVGGNIVQSAKGVTLKKILEDAGIDINSVSRIHFTCSDAHETKDLTIGYLCNQSRYYYPNLAKNWDYDDGKALDGAAEGRIAVETVIATADYWKKNTLDDNDPEPYESMITSKRFRLCFGMTDTQTVTSFNSAKWIHSIEVTLAGAPPKDKQKPKDKDKNKPVGSKKGTKNDDKTGKKKDSSKKSNKEKNTEQKKPEKNKKLETKPISGTAMTLIDVGDGSGNAENGYQPWRVSEISKDAIPYYPPGDGGGMDEPVAGATAGAMGGLLLFGGMLRFFIFIKP